MLAYTVTLRIFQTITTIDVWDDTPEDAINQANLYLGSFYQVPGQAQAVSAVLMPPADQDFSD